VGVGHRRSEREVAQLPDRLAEMQGAVENATDPATRQKLEELERALSRR
jgi:hypothetical protein